MGKPFSEKEKLEIKQRLKISCEECWNKYGYNKTNVRELCKMVGISIGSFYLFYDSKEYLFVDTADSVLQRLVDIMDKTMPNSPTKNDFVNSLKLIAKEIVKVEWILSLRNDFDILLRKLPDGYFEENFKKDKNDFLDLIKKYNLKPRITIDELTAVFWTLFSTLQYRDIIGVNYFKAFELLLESVISDIFE